MTSVRNPAVVAVAAALFFLGATPLLAQKTVPGEKWRNSVSMEMMGMKMPARTVEACVPVGKANEALARPPQQTDDMKCEMYDVKQAGNKFSGKMRCTGKTELEATMESETDGSRTKGHMQMNLSGQTMNMNYDAEKLGQACEAKDYSDYRPPAAAALPKAPDLCQAVADRMKKGELGNAVTMYVGKDATCAKHASQKTFCSAVATPAGFLDLARRERSMAAVKEGRENASVQPLTMSAQACSLGSVDALRTRLLGTAEKEASWDFLVAEGNDATWATLRQTATRECSGRSFTNAANGRYAPLCRTYGYALTRNDRASALGAAGVQGTYTGAAGSSASGNTSGGSAQPAPAAAPSQAEPADEPAPSEADSKKAKAKEALDKGKKALRGLFGGGSGE